MRKILYWIFYQMDKVFDYTGEICSKAIEDRYAIKRRKIEERMRKEDEERLKQHLIQLKDLEAGQNDLKD